MPAAACPAAALFCRLMWGRKEKGSKCHARAQAGRHLIGGAGEEMACGAGESFQKQVRRQEGRNRHVRLEEGNGLLLGGLGKWGDGLGGGAEARSSAKAQGKEGMELRRWKEQMDGQSGCRGVSPRSAQAFSLSEAAATDGLGVEEG